MFASCFNKWREDSAWTTEKREREAERERE